jgi:hypothetical protein
MAITCLPFLYAAAIAPPGTTFTGLLCGADDHCVYLSWQQQAVQGRFFIRNLFTGEPQRGIYVSCLSWLLGAVVRLTGLPPILVHHGARVFFGVLLLVLVYRLSALFTRDILTRRAAFGFTALSSGFGWLSQNPKATVRGPVDLWQPEAITFLSLYFGGLLSVALCLMVGILLLLLGAEGKTGRPRWARVVGAGVLGLLLGNVHSYDIITLSVVWLCYLGARAVVERRLPGRALADGTVAALVALPSTAYQYYLYRVEPVFRMRADDAFISPPLTSYLLGYGVVVPLAVGGCMWLVWAARRAGEPLGDRLLPISWAICGFAIPYLPFAFQRRLVMGLHLPLAILAAAGAVALAQLLTRSAPAPANRTRRAPRRREATPRPRPRLAPGLLVAGVLLLTVPTNWRFIRHDLTLAAENRTRSHVPPFLPRADREALDWAREHLPQDGLLLCSHVSGALFPALAGRQVYVGHPSETPHARQRTLEALLFFAAADASSEERRTFLQARNIRYVYQGTTERELGETDLTSDPLFRMLYRNGDAAVYEVRSPITAARPVGPAVAALPDTVRLGSLLLNNLSVRALRPEEQKPLP